MTSFPLFLAHVSAGRARDGLGRRSLNNRTHYHHSPPNIFCWISFIHPHRKWTTTATAVDTDNPLDPAFYGHAPLFTTFDLVTGEARWEPGELDTLCRRLGIVHALSNACIAFSGGRYFIARNPVPFIAMEGGATIPLRSYFNSSFLDIVARGNDIHVTWHGKRKGNPMKDDYLIRVRHCSVKKGKLLGEWGFPSGQATECSPRLPWTR